MSKITFFIKQSWLLILAAFFFGLVLALAQAALGPKILANEQEKLSTLMGSLITDANSFECVAEAVEIQGAKGKTVTTDVYQGMTAEGQACGFAFIAEGPGFADKIRLVIATDSAFATFKGFKVLASNETPGFGDKIGHDFYSQQYVGAPVGPITLVKAGDETVIDGTIVAITGATVSSTAVANIFNTYVTPLKEQLISKGLIQ